MTRFTHCVTVVGACSIVACEEPRRQQDDALSETDGTTISLRGEEQAPVAAMDSPVFLTFDNDELFFYGALSAARTDQNIIAVANQHTNQVFVFDSTGRFVRSFGRPGGGPGEFQSLLNIISIGGDTIAAYDYQMRRVSLFTSDGVLVDDYMIHAPPEAALFGPSKLIGTLGTRRLLMWSHAMSTMVDFNPPMNTPVNGPVVLFSIDATGNAATMLGEFPGDYVFASDVIDGEPTNYGPAAFGGRTWFGVLGEKPVVLINSAPTFRVLLPDVNTQTVYRGTWRAREVTRQDRERLMAIWRPSLEDATLISLWEKTIPETMPYYHAAIVGTDGIVWVEPYETWTQNDDQMYIGYDSTGVAVGKLKLPARDNLLSIGDGVALVHRFVGDGTERISIQRYRF